MQWLKVIHLVALFAWFVGLVYVPYIFAYHADAKNSDTQQVLQKMAGRLLGVLSTPAALVALVSGFALVSLGGVGVYMRAGWFHAKLMFVFALLGHHILCARTLKQLNDGTAPVRSAKFYRIKAHIPVLLLVLVTTLVLVKPF